MNYKKLNVPLKERIIFLFTGLLSVEHITIDTAKTSSVQHKQEDNININNKERNRVDSSTLNLDIPFFDLDNSATKSNL